MHVPAISLRQSIFKQETRSELLAIRSFTNRIYYRHHNADIITKTFSPSTNKNHIFIPIDYAHIYHVSRCFQKSNQSKSADDASLSRPRGDQRTCLPCLDEISSSSWRGPVAIVSMLKDHRMQLHLPGCNHHRLPCGQVECCILQVGRKDHHILDQGKSKGSSCKYRQSPKQ